MILNLSTKEFDLNTLFSFESLKEILLELAKSQIKLENEIKNIKDDNKERDKKIIYLNKFIKNNDIYNSEIYINSDENIDNDIDIGDNDFNEYEEGEIIDKQIIKQEINKENENNENIKELKYNMNNVNDNQILNNENKEENQASQNFEKKDLNINSNINKNKTEQNNDSSHNNQDQQNLTKDTNNNENKNIVQQEIIPLKNETVKAQSQFQSSPLNNTTKNDNTNKIPPSLIKKMMKELKDQKARIVKLEEDIKKEFKNIKEEETKINSLTLENKSEYNLAQDKINELIQKNREIEQVIETMQSDIQGLDFMRNFQDDGSGSIDATKVLVKALQEKVFKKFELVEQRYKKDGLENAKTKSIVDTILPKIDLIKRDLENINEVNRKNKDEFDEFVKTNENTRNEMKENIYDDINKKIHNLKEEHNIKINKLEEKISNLDKLTNKIILDLAKKTKEETIQKEKDRQIQLENLENIENKFIDINKKISGIDNTIKQHLKSTDIESIKKNISEIETTLNSKITKEDLKEIQSNIIDNMNDINDVKDSVYNYEDEVKKMRNEIRVAMQKVESFQGNIISFQNNISESGSSKKVFENPRYIEQKKMKEMINPIKNELDELIKEVYSIKRDLIEADEMNKNNLKKLILKLDEENKNIIKEFKIFVKKKYLEKIEYNKTMKTFEIQIKYLNDEKKKDSESWLLGKRNIQCFNCASCEKNINKENYTTADYLAWKKYPKGEKIHRMGQGFSHMLEMMSEDFAKKMENEVLNEDSNNYNSENNNVYASTLPGKERASSMRVKRDKNKENNIKNLKIQRNLRKMKLPKMFMFKRYDIDGNHLSDEENNRIFDEKEELDNIEGNPRIMKIFKKGNKTDANSLDNFKIIQTENK